jgi:hypothetical protein
MVLFGGLLQVRVRLQGHVNRWFDSGLSARQFQFSERQTIGWIALQSFKHALKSRWATNQKYNLQ